MAVNYYIYAGGRWCEVETRRGRVDGFRNRARFCFLQGGKLRLARSATVLRGLRALADAGSPRGPVWDAAPLPQRQPRHRRRSRRDTHAYAHHYHCCAHHDRCDVNANELRDKAVSLVTLTAPAALATFGDAPLVDSPRKRKRILSPSDDDETLKEPQDRSTKARELLQRFLQQGNKKTVVSRPLVDEESERPAKRRLTRSGVSKFRSEITKIVDVLSSDEENKSPVKGKQASPQESPQKNRNRKETNNVVDSDSSDEENDKSPVKGNQASPQESRPKNRNKKETNNVVDSDSSDQENDKSPVKRNQASSQDSPHKNRNRKETNTVVDSDSSDEQNAKSPVTRNQVSSQKSTHKNRNRKVTSDSSNDENDRAPANRNQASSQKSPHKHRNRKESNNVVDIDSSDEKHVKSPVTRNQVSSQKYPQRNRNVKETNNVVDSDSSDEDNDKAPANRKQASSQKSPHKNRNLKETDYVVESDSSDSSSSDDKHKSPVKRSQASSQPTNKNRSKSNHVSAKESQQDQKKSKIPTRSTEKQSFASKGDTEKLLHSLLKDSSSEDDSVSHNSDSSEAQAKELVIDDSDVTVLRRFLAKKGIGNLDRFDNDDEYKKRVFYKLNPLVCISRYKPLENLLRQKMTLNEFARNLGLRSVADVTPEKRYRMRRSTQQARTVAGDSETDKENIAAKSKRRKLWNNDAELFNSVTSRSSEVRPRPAPKPVLTEDSSKETSDSDIEFKRKVREQLERKAKQRASGADQNSVVVSSSVTDKDEHRSTRSTRKAPGLKEQKRNKLSESKKEKASAPVESSEQITRRTRSSDRGVKIAARPLKEQNKVAESSDSAFETKNSPKKPNLKGKDATRKTGDQRNKDQLQKNSRQTENIKELQQNPRSPRKDGQAERIEKNKSTVVKRLPVKFKKSSVAAGREYTSLEDQAIVAWVSVGGRERRVNGNAVWRELESQYTQITGQNRSWHSLRNRYLRHVLPSMGRMALPPAQVSRLRAAAATGVMKAKGSHQRRNSIFGAPTVRSASTASVKTREQLARAERETTPTKGADSPSTARGAESPSKARGADSPSKARGADSPSKAKREDPPPKTRGAGPQSKAKREDPQSKTKREDPPSKARREDTPPKAKAPSPRRLPLSPPTPTYSAITRKFASRVPRASVPATSSPVKVNKKKRRRVMNW